MQKYEGLYDFEIKRIVEIGKLKGEKRRKMGNFRLERACFRTQAAEASRVNTDVIQYERKIADALCNAYFMPRFSPAR